MTAQDLSSAPLFPSYEQLNKILGTAEFDEYVERGCRSVNTWLLGRASLASVIDFRLLNPGDLSGIDFESKIASQARGDSGIPRSLGCVIDESTPNNSMLSRTRRRIEAEVFGCVLGRLREMGLAKGKTVVVDSTTLDANATLNTLWHQDTRGSYREFVERLAENRDEVRTVEEVIDFDRRRPGKTLSKSHRHTDLIVPITRGLAGTHPMRRKRRFRAGLLLNVHSAGSSCETEHLSLWGDDRTAARRGTIGKSWRHKRRFRPRTRPSGGSRFSHNRS